MFFGLAIREQILLSEGSGFPTVFPKGRDSRAARKVIVVTVGDHYFWLATIKRLAVIIRDYPVFTVLTVTGSSARKVTTEYPFLVADRRSVRRDPASSLLAARGESLGT